MSIRQGRTYQKILRFVEKGKSGFVLLIDPDDLSFEQIAPRVETAMEAGVDIFFVGGSFLIGNSFDKAVCEIKRCAGDHPVIIFPGSVQQISPHADALLFLSLISGRNPEHLIGSQAIAAPILWKIQLEPISCGYMLIESGSLTSAEFVSNSFPIPRNKPSIGLAHALAAQYLGMKSIYLEAGSGAKLSVPENMIALIRKNIDIPVFVGGGIRTPEDAAKKVAAGADFVVVGNFFEDRGNHARIKDFAAAIHQD